MDEFVDVRVIKSDGELSLVGWRDGPVDKYGYVQSRSISDNRVLKSDLDYCLSNMPTWEQIKSIAITQG